MQIGDPCYRDRDGVAALKLPFRVTLPDGSTRTDPSQWSEDAGVLAAAGWTCLLYTSPSPRDRG